MRIILALLFLAPSNQLWAADITFVDAGVKALCVANWDTNEDGELSEEEAAAVTTLGTVFRERTNIGAFPELRYFTGITAIDDYAFYKSTISGELRVPGNVKTIGKYAFNSCRQLTAVVLEEGVEEVGWHGFSGPISKLSLPTSLTFMSSMAIDPYDISSSSIVLIPDGDLYVYSYSKNPPPVNDFAFYYVFGDGHLIVPQDCKEAYKAAEGWSHFMEYLEMGDVNGDGAVNVVDVATLIAYVTGQEPKPFKAVVADVNGDGLVDANDVDALCRLLLQ